ncbi:MAG: hypothetical protein AB1446_07160 [Bacillota bacterium]
MRLRPLTPREKTIVAAGLVLLIIGALGVSLFLPAVTRLQALRLEVAEGEKVVGRLRELEGQEAALEKRLQELRKAVASAGVDPGTPFDAADVVMLLKSAEDTWNLSFLKLTLGVDGKGVLTIQVSGTGGYRQVSEFLQALRVFPRTASMSLTTLGPAEGGVSFDLQVGFQLNPGAPAPGPAAPRPGVKLRVPPVPAPAEGRENPFSSSR